jgi:putative ATP-binding cassette transporter
MLPFTGRWTLAGNALLGVLSGLWNFLFIHQVTQVIGQVTAGTYTAVSPGVLLRFGLLIAAFVWTRRVLSLSVVKVSQALFWGLRKQIVAKVLHATYPQFAARRDKVHAVVVNDINTLTQASLTVVDFFTSLILAAACLCYMASMSGVLFGITLLTAAAGVGVYYAGSRKNAAEFERARKLEGQFLKHFHAILNGFKEMYMEPRKGQAVYADKITGVATEAYDNNVRAFSGFINNQITGRILFYVLLSAILLVFSVALGVTAGDTVGFVFTLLYLLGAIEMIMALLPGLVRARVAADHLADLRQELENARFNPLPPGCPLGRDAFGEIAVQNLEFRYAEDGSSFGVGPASLEIRRGEAIFIYGGNGSGKTTFVNTVLGLNPPSAGEIRLNGVPVTGDNYTDYRTAFAVVFSDFYLFDELLGVAAPDPEKWTWYLHLFELQDKVSLTGRSFSTTNLSAGQRKRLALIAALLEEKPVLVLDEWAADQDPYFRKKFYTEIIPALKQEGIAIVAITHDDKYYHCADKLYKMDAGKLVAETPDGAPGLVPAAFDHLVAK